MVAFVVGNGNYEHIPKLKNAVPDAKAIVDVLEKRNVEIYSAYDCDIEDLKEKFALFAAAVRAGDAVFMYFACHAEIFDNCLRLKAISKSSTRDIEADSLNLEELVAWSATRHPHSFCTVNIHAVSQCLQDLIEGSLPHRGFF